MTSAEEFLRSYHDARPEAASELAERGRVVGDGRSVYEVFADRVVAAKGNTDTNTEAKPQAVLDLGCGDGALLAALKTRGVAKVAGLDLSPGQLAAARKRPELGEADLKEGRAQKLPFADNEFDTVVSFMALMLMADVEQVVAEVARVLAPGGTLAIGVGGGGREAMEVFLKVARPLFAVVPQERRVPVAGDPRTRTREGLDQLLTPKGFEPVGWERIVVDFGGTPDEVWQTCHDSYYQMVTLDETHKKGLRTAFTVATRNLVTAEGRLAASACIDVAVTRLR
ncbi:class I SAM-dependent methyltransferase [Amycolatopsis rhabdoformis]|uniref:Class I SAM-dependent methyltransferase n=1 Tax=Amycolatopsis rhabdoformis TaxID=1448059 RepID=A0ABZ1HY92_9PSEU|nr:class I SAM-dependent methyltransferase [Amycolatopsis rhabdoformis]WSE26486.1 class I SAM-dependent methyltransferase [Amycolatopsis rhabdoformis]